MILRLEPAQTQAVAALPPMAAYEALVARGALKPDAAQAEAANALQNLYERLAPPKRRLFSRAKAEAPRGLYIWGEVGRGKSMLMDLFFHVSPVKKKRRVHFHAFMQEVHSAIHRIRKQGLGDPVAVLVSEIAAKTRLLCFDELQAPDVADATLLFRLFDGLFAAGVTVVATGNRPPAEIYQGGVQAERFGKFIGLMMEHMDIVSLMSDTDYRRTGTHGSERYYYPLGPEAERFIEQALARLAPNATPSRQALEVQGRKVWVTAYNSSSRGAQRRGDPDNGSDVGIARASFDELCGQPLGPADYLAIAQRFETLILTGIPLLTPEKRNEAKRFVALVDALYEHKARLIATAAAPPDALYPAGDGSFEFKRTASRLIEMINQGSIT